MRIPDGTIYLTRFCGPRYDVLHHACNVRRIQGKTVRISLLAKTDGDGRVVWQEKRQGILRLVEPGEARPAGRRAARDCEGIAFDASCRFCSLCELCPSAFSVLSFCLGFLSDRN